MVEEDRWYSEAEITSQKMPGLPKSFVKRGLKLLVGRGDLEERINPDGTYEYRPTNKGTAAAQANVAQQYKPQIIPENILLKYTTANSIRAKTGFKTLTAMGLLKKYVING